MTQIEVDFRRGFGVAKIVGLAVFVLLAIFLLFSSMYTVEPDEEGVILTLGKYSGSVGPGLHFKLPYPLQRVYLPKVTEVKRLEVGFRLVDPGPPAIYRDHKNDKQMAHEAQMITGDENIVNVDLIVLYRIASAQQYLFNISEHEATLRAVTEAATRQVVGDLPIDNILTVGKTEIQTGVQQKIQEVSEMYGFGVQVLSVQLGEVQPPVSVAAAFKDVATAKEDRAKIINKSQGYQNEKIPTAEGQAAQIIKAAEAYRAERITMAEGDAERFLALVAEYKKAPGVTKERLYQETLQRVLRKRTLKLVDPDVSMLVHSQLNAK